MRFHWDFSEKAGIVGEGDSQTSTRFLSPFSFCLCEGWQLTRYFAMNIK